MCRRAPIALGFALLLAAPLWPAAAPAPARQDSQAAPVFSSEVSLVLLPAFVVDRAGRAVAGLRADEFRIEEDGRPAEIVSFRYVDTTQDEEQAELRTASAARRRFLLLFDKSVTDLGGLARARRAAGDFVRRRLALSDLAAVATFDVHNGIRLVANFTDDRALLAHAVDTLGVPSLSHISDPLALAADLAATDLTVNEAGDPGSTNQALIDNVAAVLVHQMRSAEEQAYRHQVTVLLDSFEGLARALRGVEGRKQVLYFSEGFDGRMLVGQWGSEEKAVADSVVSGRLWEVDGRTRYGDSGLRDALDSATRSLANADTVVHAIDVTGLGRDHSLTQAGVETDPIRDTSNRQSLGYLSEETGGRLFTNANGLAPVLAEMLEMTSRYYVLGFQPERRKGPGVFHRIEVKVARKDVKVSHRPGYFERGAVARQSTLERQFDLAELVVTGAGGNELPFDALCLPFPEPGERQTLGIVMQVPRESLQRAERQPEALEAYAYAVGADGTVRDHLAQLARIDPKRADPEGRSRGLSLFGTLKVPPGKYTVRLMVRQSDTGRSAARFLEVTVPRYDERAAFALPPLVLDPAERWLSVEMGKAGPGRAARPFHVQAEPFVPRASFEVRPGVRERLALIVWDPALPGDPAADVEIHSSLTARDGRAVAPGRLRIEQVHREEGGRRTFVFAYTPDAVEAGDYTLRIGIGEAGSLAEAYTLLRVRPGS